MKSITAIALILFSVMPACAAPLSVLPSGRSAEDVAVIRQTAPAIVRPSASQQLAVITHDCAENFIDNMARAEVRLLRTQAGDLGRRLGAATADK